jgi:hypothetical protein
MAEIVSTPMRRGVQAVIRLYLTLPRIRLGLGTKELSCGLTFVALSRVTSLSGLLFTENLDWEQMKKLGSKFLQLRLEDTKLLNL